MIGLEDLYQQVIVEHAKERHGFGLIDDSDGSSHQLNPTCGDEISLQVKRDGETIVSVHWEGRGCSISQASASVLTDLVHGRTEAEAIALAGTFRELMQARHEPLSAEKLQQLDDGAAFAGVARYPARVKCAMLGWVALLDAIGSNTTRRTP